MEKVSKKPLISVIVPVYNVEKYLEKCINSIINQSYKKLEILLIDDGSTDNSSKICDNFNKIDKRIKVLHKKNGGLSDARNVGIDNSKGEYITFIDSDDYISKSFIEYLYYLLNKYNTSISVVPYIIVNDKKVIKTKWDKNEKVLKQKNAIEHMILDKDFTVSACSKMFEKKLFNNIRFPCGRLFEDTATTYKLFLKCKEISYGGEAGYYYYKREASIINSDFNINQMDFIYFTDSMAKEVAIKFPDIKQSLESKKIDARFSVLRRMVVLKKPTKQISEEKEKIIKYIKNRKKRILRGSYNRKIKIATILLSLGEPTFKFFWLLYSKIKYEL